MNLPRLKVSWKELALNLTIAASLFFAASAFGEGQADVIEPSSKTKWQLRSEAGQQVAVYSMATGKPKFVGSMNPKNKPLAVQQMDKLIDAGRMATFRKVTGPHQEVIAERAGPLDIRFEIKDGVQSASVSGVRLTMAEAKGLRDLIWRLESFASQIKP